MKFLSDMNKKQKKNLVRIIAAAVILICLQFIPVSGIVRLILFIIPYVIVGYDILLKALQGIIHKQPFDESLLMSIATLGAFALALYSGSGDYNEAIAVMLFFQIGEWFQSYAVGRSRRSISDLMDIRPDYANIEDGAGGFEKVDPDDVEIGTVIIIQPGEKIPLDGVVVEGTSTLNTAALTGESAPRDVGVGDEVLSGCINAGGLLRVETTREFDESTASRILELIEDASSNKSRSEAFIARFARVYTPIVVGLALALAVIPPVVSLITGADPLWSQWIYRALTFLVISCPCALVISIPLSFFAGIGGASREGILIKGSNYLEALSDVTTVVFDKTGTLTKGSFEVSAVHPDKIDAKHLLHLAAHVERYSTHPIAASLRAAYPDEKDDCLISDTEEIAGRGIRAVVNGQTVCVGNTKMMEDVGASWRPCHHPGTIIHVAIDGEYAGHIVISDLIKEHSALAISELKKKGINRLIMLTGDSAEVAKDVAEKIGIEEYYAELLPGDKVSRVEELISSMKAGGSKISFVGDGINDAPVLMRSDVGIAMGALGSDAAIEAADVVLMDDDPLRISTAVAISRKCMRIVKENIWFAIGIKTLCLLLGALGIANMWAAIFADVGVMILAVLNAIRCMKIRKSPA